MNIEEFNARLKALDEHLAAALQWFHDDTNVTIHSIYMELNEQGEYIVNTGLDFPDSANND